MIASEIWQACWAFLAFPLLKEILSNEASITNEAPGRGVLRRLSLFGG
jgi:hypothetical protein